MWITEARPGLDMDSAANVIHPYLACMTRRTDAALFWLLLYNINSWEIAWVWWQRRLPMGIHLFFSRQYTCEPLSLDQPEPKCYTS